MAKRLALAAAAAAAAVAAPARPNIVFFLTDDQDVLLDSMRYMNVTNELIVNRGATFNWSFAAVPVSAHSPKTLRDKRSCTTPSLLAPPSARAGVLPQPRQPPHGAVPAQHARVEQLDPRQLRGRAVAAGPRAAHVGHVPPSRGLPHLLRGQVPQQRE